MHPLQGTAVAERVLFAPIDLSIRALRSMVNLRLEALLQQGGAEGQLLDRAVRSALLAPGKRIRPMLALLAARVLGVDTACILDAACALEMLHAASLILDDLPCMDNADSRRGLPATHVAFGQDVALLAVVSLICRAFGVVAGSATLPTVARPAIVAILADAAGQCGLSAGQMKDLRAPAHEGNELQIEQINHLKTGVLFVAAVDIPLALCGGADRRDHGMREFARLFGLAFQLRDDIDDAPSGVNGSSGEGANIVGTHGPRAAALRLRHYRAAMHLCLSSLRRDEALPGCRDTLELSALLDCVFGEEH